MGEVFVYIDENDEPHGVGDALSFQCTVEEFNLMGKGHLYVVETPEDFKAQYEERNPGRRAPKCPPGRRRQIHSDCLRHRPNRTESHELGIPVLSGRKER